MTRFPIVAALTALAFVILVPLSQALASAGISDELIRIIAAEIAKQHGTAPPTTAAPAEFAFARPIAWFILVGITLMALVFRRRIAALGVGLILLLSVLGHAHAQAAVSPTAVTIPYGAWLEALAPTIASVLGAIVLWAFRALPANVVGTLKTLRVDQLLDRAITYAVNATVGAAKDKVLTVDVANEVLAKALRYARDHGAPALVKWAGGEEKIREKIMARLAVDQNVALR